MLNITQKRMIFSDTVIFTIGGLGSSRILPRVMNGMYSGLDNSDLAEVQSFLNSIDLNVQTVVDKIVVQIKSISEVSFPD